MTAPDAPGPPVVVPDLQSAFPLFDRFPALRTIPRVELTTLPTPVVQVRHPETNGNLWIKRDDLSAPDCGGNKVRALEFLLGQVEPGDTILTVGGAGSTHVLSTATHAGRIGASVVALRWKHDMNAVAVEVASRISEALPHSRVGRSAVLSLMSASYQRWRTRAHYIPLGGSIPTGILGHVNAALELARQIADGVLPMPERVVVPLGSGGTTAGLLLGFAIAGLPIEVTGVRVGPRAFVNRRHVMSLVRRTSALIERLTGERLTGADPHRLRVLHDFYGGAYGRALRGAERAEQILHDAIGVRLDGTYSAKAWTAAIAQAAVTRGPVLFWLTFDARCLTN